MSEKPKLVVADNEHTRALDIHGRQAVIEDEIARDTYWCVVYDLDGMPNGSYKLTTADLEVEPVSDPGDVLLSGTRAKEFIARLLGRGMQVIYIPDHAEGDENHPDCEFGFVTSVRGDVAFCRYWRKGHPGELRTVANSEGTPIRNLVAHDSVPQSVIDAWLEGQP